MAALIGAVGSIVGGAVGGWLAILAARRQWERDQATSRASRSHEAAMSIAGAVDSVQEALIDWLADPDDPAALRRAYNSSSRTVGMQSMALADPELRVRVKWFMDQFAEIARLAVEDGVKARSRGELLDHDTRDLLRALEAHSNGQALPLYVPPPQLNDVPPIFWRSLPTRPMRDMPRSWYRDVLRKSGRNKTPKD